MIALQILLGENTKEQLSKLTDSVGILRKWLLRNEISSHLETKVLEQNSREKKIGTKQKPPISFQDRVGCVCKRGLFGIVSHKEIHLSTISVVPKLGITYKHF